MDCESVNNHLTPLKQKPFYRRDAFEQVFNEDNTESENTCLYTGVYGMLYILYGILYG